jgi:metallophosphoesterase (TIGR00282 family)
MNVIFIGDIVGAAAVAYLAERLPGLRREHAADLVVANAENCLVSGPEVRSGFGMSVEAVETLFASGVDVITGGNHSWDGPHSATVLEHSRVLRPYNVPDGTPGRGLLSLEVAGQELSVINLAGASAVPEALPVYKSWLAARPPGTTIVDFHGESPIEKQAFAFAVDGEAAAVLGTHTHEPTLPLHLLPGGTALVTDVGMTGPLGGLAGIDPGPFVAALKEETPAAGTSPLKLAPGPVALGAVLLRVAGERTTGIQRLG